MRTLILLAVLAMTVAPAAAQRTLTPEAQLHLDAALAAYGKADYDTASRELERAYAIDPDPALLYTRAQALRLGDRCEVALDVYRAYVATGVNEAQAQAAQTGIALCEEVLKVKQAAVPTPPPDVVPDRRIAPPPPMERPGPRPWYRDPIGGALTGAGVVGIGVGIGFVVASNSSKQQAEGETMLGAFEDRLAEANSRRKFGIAALVAGGALATGGVLVYVLRDRAPRDTVVTTDGTSVYVSARF